MISTAEVKIERPRRYGKQLASHLGHKLESTETETGWTLVRESSTARIVVGDEQLTLVVDAPDADSMASLQNVLDRHLRKFAAAVGELDIEWVVSEA